MFTSRCEKNLGGYVPDGTPNLNERLKVTSQEISALQKATESYKVDVTLDPETACSRLILSEDLKNARMLGCIPHLSNKFPREAFVWGRERITSGRHYWVVKVSSKQWAAGISRDSVRKKKSINPNTDDSIWAVGVKPHDKYTSEVCIFPEVDSFYLEQNIRKLHVALNYEEGRVEFYDECDEFIYAFTSISFSGEEIRPFFFVPDHGSLIC
ncbi:probable E3 ubiquitin-protein ligase TRIML1 [Anolis sagrei]|uniref:probable E3 ubiquitin-protein ligase TRIML1 n=1 Tax=Anolis sagrei TaxID=38937 RepID=UPI00352105E2